MPSGPPLPRRLVEVRVAGRNLGDFPRPVVTAKDIQRALIRDRYKRTTVIPNYTPAGWFECDLFELTAAGFFVEYEIKLSLADFRRDAEKFRREWDPAVRVQIDRVKHHEIAAADPRGPSRFWYVVPEGLLTPEIVPQWAGLIIARHRSGYSRPHDFTTEELKSAPRLHKVKADLKILPHATGVCYWRMHDLLLHKA
jgi:hypothetical protein